MDFSHNTNLVAVCGEDLFKIYELKKEGLFCILENVSCLEGKNLRMVRFMENQDDIIVVNDKNLLFLDTEGNLLKRFSVNDSFNHIFVKKNRFKILFNNFKYSIFEFDLEIKEIKEFNGF